MMDEKAKITPFKLQILLEIAAESGKDNDRKYLAFDF